MVKTEGGIPTETDFLLYFDIAPRVIDEDVYDKLSDSEYEYVANISQILVESVHRYSMYDTFTDVMQI